MKTHFLKCWPPFFQQVADGEKPFEIRVNDRDYQVGDKLLLREWKPGTKKYTGRQLMVKVTYMTNLSMVIKSKSRREIVAMAVQPIPLVSQHE